MSTTQDVPASPSRHAVTRFLQRALGRLLDKAIDALVLGAVVAAFGIAATSVLLWGESLVDWLGKTEEMEHWLLMFLVFLGAMTPIAGGLAVRIVNSARFREPANVEIICSPAVIDLSGFGPGSSIATVRATDRDGRPARNARVEFLAYSQATESSSSLRTDRDGIASFQIDASKSMTPGILIAHAWVLRQNALPLAASVDITCVGQPVFITLAGAPNVVVAGEAVTVLATISDALNQNVWDGTKVELKASTGQMSSGLVETFGGVATDFLLTSVPGRCTIVATVKGVAGTLINTQLAVDVMPPHQSAREGA